MVETPAAPVFLDLPHRWGQVEVLEVCDDGDNATIVLRLTGRPHRRTCPACGEQTVLASANPPARCGWCGADFDA